MWRPFAVISIAFALFFVSDCLAQTETPTPTPGVERFADFNADRYVAPADVMMMLTAWYQSGLTIPEGLRGAVTGSLKLNDGCGNCTGIAGGFWVFLTGDGGEFLTKTEQGGTFNFVEIPAGSYSLIAGGMGDLYCHKVVESVPVPTSGTYVVGEVCLAPDLGAQCSGKCPVDTWAVGFIAQEFGGAGIWALNADGTITGTMTFEDDEEPPRTATANVTGTYTVGAECAFSYSVTVTPRGDGGDCPPNGTYTSTEGQIYDFCSRIEGTWTSDATFNCGGEVLAGPTIGAFSMVVPEGKGTETIAFFEQPSAKVVSAPPVAKGGPGLAQFDLNDDGRVNHADMLILVAQWHLRIPDGPTCTPLPTCTPTPTDDEGNGGTPEPTPTLDPALLEGWWEFDWHLTQPINLEWSSLINLGEPGAIEDFDSQDLFDNVTMTYTFNPDTGKFVMQVQGDMTAIGATGSFSFEATGDMNAQKTIISNGAFDGTLQGNLGSRAMSGTFVAYKCCVEGEQLDCDCNRP